MVARAQLLDAGLTAPAIHHRLATGRLHPVGRGVYAVGRRTLGQRGRWMAALLSCGPAAFLSHQSAAVYWRIRRALGGPTDITVPASVRRRAPPGLVVHRRRSVVESDATDRQGLRIATPLCTLIDLATRLRTDQLERAIGEADKRGLIREDALCAELAAVALRPGVARLRTLVASPGFVMTHSETERLFVPIAAAAGLPRPLTQAHLSGPRVDFHCPKLGLVVEVDGLRYHRTAAQQLEDRRRDQAHAAAGRTQLRFAYRQVKFEQTYVASTLASVARRLGAEI